MIAPDYERYDFAGMGAFDVYLLAKQYAPQSDAKQYYSHWRGGYYLAAHSKSAPKNQIALVYFSRWDSPEAARAFATLYNSYTPQRYELTPSSSPSAAAQADSSGDMTFAWDFGPSGKVIITTHGSDMLVLEGFSDSVVLRARGLLL